jgi:hypothetical protein
LQPRCPGERPGDIDEHLVRTALEYV